MKKIYLFLFILALFITSYINDGFYILSSTKKDIEVEIKGEVINPGVYTLKSGSTVNDLLELAQLNEFADSDSLNGNIVLKNDDLLIVREKKDEQKVSINTGDLEQLMTLPHIGQVIAQRIIDYRNENGLFQKLEDLMKVKGIGEKTFQGLVDLICL